MDMEEEWKPEIKKDLVLGYLVLVDDRSNAHYEELIATTYESFISKSNDGIQETIRNVSGYEIKGVVNAPFPTYRFSAYIPIADSQHGEGDICILGFQYPGQEPVNYHKVMLDELTNELNKCKDKESKGYLLKCIETCKKHSKQE
jgi:hypothetical protein